MQFSHEDYIYMYVFDRSSADRSKK